MTLFEILREQPLALPGRQGDPIFQMHWRVIGRILARDGSAALAEAKRQGFLAPVIAPAAQQASTTPS